MIGGKISKGEGPDCEAAKKNYKPLVDFEKKGSSNDSYQSNKKNNL